MSQTSTQSTSANAANAGPSSSRGRPLTLAVLVAGGLVAGVFYFDPFGTSNPAQPEDLPGKGSPTVESQPRKPLVGEPMVPFQPKLERDPAKAVGKLKLADGTYVAPLNGVVNPPVASWDQNRPYSPIVGKKVEFWPGLGNLEFYVHEDGSKTTTYMTNATRDGKTRREPHTYVNHPLPEGTPPPGILAPGGGLEEKGDAKIPPVGSKKTGK